MVEISVLMSVYNGARWINDSINSVLHQSLGNFEFIIINDGSTDATPRILNSYSDERLLIINQKNSGLTKSLNVGLKRSKGNFIARIDAGDICVRDRFKRQKEFLDKNSDLVLVGSNTVLIDEYNNQIGRAKYPTSHERILERLRRFQPVFPHSTIFFRKDVVIEEGCYNEYFVRSQDYDLYLRLCKKYRIGNLDDFLIKLRLDRNSLSYGDDNLQLKMGIAALICYYRREKGLQDFSRSHYDEWLLFLKNVDEWLSRNKFDRKRNAKKDFRCFRTLFKQKRVSEGLFSLFACFRNDPTFFLYRDIKLDAPKDFESFMANN